MQRKIGEVFTTSDGVTLKVKEPMFYCEGCYFLEWDGLKHKCSNTDFGVTGECEKTDYETYDYWCVIFVEVKSKNKLKL